MDVTVVNWIVQDTDNAPALWIIDIEKSNLPRSQHSEYFNVINYNQNHLWKKFSIFTSKKTNI